MKQAQLVGANILPVAGYITKSPGDTVKTSIHWQWSVPTGSHTFHLWSIFGKYDEANGQFAFMSGAMFGQTMSATGTNDDWSDVIFVLGELGDVYAGDWDSLLLISENADFTSGFIYDMAVVLNTLTIIGTAITADLLEAGFY